MNALILTLLFMTTTHPYDRYTDQCPKPGIYKDGPYTGPKGGCYCINPKNGRKKYIKRSYCENRM